ncbi:hypothetical protein HDU67_004178, partial [Dinochytrium kinnereticum]
MLIEPLDDDGPSALKEDEKEGGQRYLRLRSLSVSSSVAASGSPPGGRGGGGGRRGEKSVGDVGALPHSRKPYDQAVEDLTADAMECWKAAFLHAYAEASVMRAKGSAHDTYAKIVSFMELSLRNLTLFIRGQFLPSRESWAASRTFRRYLAFTYIPDPRARKRAVSAPPAPPPAPLSGKNLMTSLDAGSGSVSMPGYVVAGFAAIEWNVSDRHVWLQELGCLGQQGLSGNSMIPAMFRALEERVQEDLVVGRRGVRVDGGWGDVVTVVILPAVSVSASRCDHATASHAVAVPVTCCEPVHAIIVVVVVVVVGSASPAFVPVVLSSAE